MKRYALFIGINEYEDRAINDLSCACNDAEKLAEAFHNYDDVQVMLNNDVSQTKVIATVDKLIKDSKSDDVFLFYFSGHSCEISGEHHLLCSDARQELLQFDIGTIQLNAIKKLTDKPGLRRLFILDSCRTELYTNTRNTTGCPKSRGVSFGSVLKQHANAQIIPPVILTSCSSGEYAYEDDASGHGYFTLALLHTLKSPLSSIDDFRTKLDLNINSFRLPGMQTVCWNGSLSHNLPFINWQSETSAGSDSLMLRELERIRRERAELEAAEQLRIERAKLEKLKAEIQAREEAERKAREEAERKAREEAERKARIEAERKAKEDAERKAKEEAERKAKEEAERKVTFSLNGGVKFNMIRVEPGTFTMSANDGDNYSDEVAHRVTLTQPFYIGETQVTQAQWRAVMGMGNNLWKALMGDNPSYFKGDDRPVEFVNWHKAMAFCEKLNKDGYAPKGWKFTLPTEAQWEFAARGGIKSKGFKYSGSDKIGDVAWYVGNSDSKTHPVRGKKANELGLYDMSGNVWEWCLDWYRYQKNFGRGAVTDPQRPNKGSSRVLRGGSWINDACYCRSASRGCYDPDDRDSRSGFRVALVPVQ